ncbi:MAG: 23S rRNA (pseudouridine(1915)-N(3))-methyltransferase RlmH [Opitutales bacterium]|nr:23S rRNA (pseudouridine(1915)-N(3))-methyltransferase RlmH [Opitutales bacterium]
MIKLVAVGKMKNRALDSLCNDYFERLSRYDKFELVLIKDSTVQRESERMLELISSSKLRTYVLSEEGKLFSSRDFSKIIERDLMLGGSMFVIGGAYGMSEDVKRAAHALVSLSPMTFTHEWARAILAEQLYRAKTISADTGYHH